ncbi:DUF6188 family protein [Kitasatospora sp. NBC_00458]|uniref:DUF6188 family protein n=1 Tax=Kitasatospora sp. NBC_00458 TaxID=2903568 RepID=UPI002E1700F3
MRTDTTSVEHADRWVPGLRGRPVTGVGTTPHLVLSLAPGWEVGVEGPALLSHGPVHANPGLPLAPASRDLALRLLGASVLSAVAFKSGALRVVFDTGLHLTCPGESSAWRITGPERWCFTSVPGGGLTVLPGPGSGPGSAPGTAGAR